MTLILKVGYIICMLIVLLTLSIIYSLDKDEINKSIKYQAQFFIFSILAVIFSPIAIILAIFTKIGKNNK